MLKVHFFHKFLTHEDKTSILSTNQMGIGSEADALQDVEINCELSTKRENKATRVDGYLARFVKAVSREICKWLTNKFGENAR